MSVRAVLEEFSNRLKSVNLDKVDLIRNKSQRIEVVSSMLLAASELNDTKRVIALQKNLISRANPDFSFDEKFYGNDDEDVGAYGAVPTAFALFSLARSFKCYERNTQLLRILIKIGDFLFDQEIDGKVIKGMLNRSKAFNTDLLVAIALNELKSILNSNSIRSRMYDECIRRLIFRTLKAQFLNGSFPYQTYTYRVPFLYHVMVTAQLGYLSLFYESGLINYGFFKGKRFIEKNIVNQDFDINWEKANDHDKKGAVWIYGFLLNVFPKDSREYDKILNKILISQKKGLFGTSIDSRYKNDIFFSSWVINALVMTSRKKTFIIESRKVNFFKIIFLITTRFLLNVKMTYRYVNRTFLNRIFYIGAHENSDPRD